MDLQATAQLLGNFGEFIGAIAVVGTLGYLAVQIRQNTHQIRVNATSLEASTYQSLITHVIDLNRGLAADPHLSDILVKTREGEIPEGADLTRFLKLAPHGEANISKMPKIGQFVESEVKSANLKFKKMFYFLAYFNLTLVFLIVLIFFTMLVNGINSLSIYLAWSW